MSYSNPTGIDVHESLSSPRLRNAIEELVIAVIATAEAENKEHPGSIAINLANMNVLMVQTIHLITDAFLYAQKGAMKEMEAREGGN